MSFEEMVLTSKTIFGVRTFQELFYIFSTQYGETREKLCYVYIHFNIGNLEELKCIQYFIWNLKYQIAGGRPIGPSRIKRLSLSKAYKFCLSIWTLNAPWRAFIHFGHSMWCPKQLKKSLLFYLILKPCLVAQGFKSTKFLCMCWSWSPFKCQS